MEYKMKKLALIPLVGLIAACEKTPPETVMSQQMYEYKVAQVEKQIDKMPKWYTAIPKEDDAVYAVGTAVKQPLQIESIVEFVLK
jgi:hypothetical protein